MLEILTKEQKIKMFLDFWNNFLSVEKFAEHYQLDEILANEIINQGRIVNNHYSELETDHQDYPSIEDYLETHYEIVSTLERMLDMEGSLAEIYKYNYGIGGMYELAKKMTEDFQGQYKLTMWGQELDWNDTLHSFITSYKIHANV